MNKHAAMVSYTLTGMSQNSPVCANTSLIRRVKTPGALGRVSVTTGGSNVLSCSTTGSESSSESVSSERNESLSGLGTYVRISNLLDGVKTTPFFRVDGAATGFFNAEVIVIGAFFRAECSALAGAFLCTSTACGGVESSAVADEDTPNTCKKYARASSSTMNSTSARPPARSNFIVSISVA